MPDEIINLTEEHLAELKAMLGEQAFSLALARVELRRAKREQAPQQQASADPVPLRKGGA